MKNRTKICLLYDFSCSDMINCSKSEQIKHHLCSKLWVRPCGATEGFGRVHFMKGGGCLKHKLRISAPFCLLPLFENQKLLHHPRNKTTNTHTEEMHRKPEVSLFSIIAILTINCVINAIQRLCKQAVSDVVSYLQYEDNKNDAFGVFFIIIIFPAVMGLVFPGIFSLLKPQSSHLHRHWFHSGWRTGLQISSVISVPKKPHILRKLPFS